MSIPYTQFEGINIRVGTIIKASIFPEARKPAYQLQIDFGPLGMKQSSAQLTFNYAIADLVGKQVVAVVNFAPKQIANFTSECLVLAAVGEDQSVSLLVPDHPMPNGTRIA
jgi:tRNA-binding protein